MEINNAQYNGGISHWSLEHKYMQQFYRSTFYVCFALGEGYKSFKAYVVQGRLVFSICGPKPKCAISQRPVVIQH